MQSKIYPNIFFRANENLSFIGSQLIQAQSLEVLGPKDPNIKKYTKAAQKLFSQISVLEQMVWICRIPSTSIVRIYFSEPYQYPTAHCCLQPLYIQLGHDLSGSIGCTHCLKTIAKFVYTDGQIGNDQELFFLKQRQERSRKQNLRDLFTSQRFRGKKLKNNFVDELKLGSNGNFIMEVVPTFHSKTVSRAQKGTPQDLVQMRDIINDIFS